MYMFVHLFIYLYFTRYLGSPSTCKWEINIFIISIFSPMLDTDLKGLRRVTYTYSNRNPKKIERQILFRMKKWTDELSSLSLPPYMNEAGISCSFLCHGQIWVPLIGSDGFWLMQNRGINIESLPIGSESDEHPFRKGQGEAKLNWYHTKNVGWSCIYISLHMHVVFYK